MSASSARSGRAHLVGLAFAIALGGLSVFAVRFITWLVQGSIVEELWWLSAFGTVVAVLAIGEALWPRIATRLDPAIGEK